MAVISLEDSRDMMPLRSVFPQAEQYRAVDLRGSDIMSLYKSGSISASALDTLQKGRKWHKELSSKGAVGLQQSNRLLLGRDIETPILVLEDDCIVEDEIRQHCDYLLSNMDEFDVAVFGPLAYFTQREQVEGMEEGWYSSDNVEFWGLHCVLYTPKGRRIVAEEFSKPQEVQIDHMLGFMHNEKKLKLVFHDGLARQAIQHESTIQNECQLCNVESYVIRFDLVMQMTLAVLIVASLLFLVHSR